MMTGARSAEDPATVVIAINIIDMDKLRKARAKLAEANQLNKQIIEAWDTYIGYRVVVSVKIKRDFPRVINHDGTVLATLTPEQFIECTQGLEEKYLKRYEDLCKQLVEIFK